MKVSRLNWKNFRCDWWARIIFSVPYIVALNRFQQHVTAAPSPPIFHKSQSPQDSRLASSRAAVWSQWRRQRSKKAKSFRGQKIIKLGRPQKSFFPKKLTTYFSCRAQNAANAADCFTVKIKQIKRSDMITFLFSVHTITSFSAWHCWLGHLTRKNPSPIWPMMCLLGR